MQIDWFPLWLSLRVAALSTAVAAGARAVAGLSAGQSRVSRQGSAGRGGDAAAGAAAHGARLLPAGAARAGESARASCMNGCSARRWCSPGRRRWWRRCCTRLPLLVKSARAALESVDRSYERAARNLGASEWRVFWRVTPAAGAPLDSGRDGTGLRPLARRFRRHHHDRRQHPGHARRRSRWPSTTPWRAGNGALARTLVLVISAVALAILYARQPAGRRGRRRDDPGPHPQSTSGRAATRAAFSLDVEFAGRRRSDRAVRAERRRARP